MPNLKNMNFGKFWNYKEIKNTLYTYLLIIFFSENLSWDIDWTKTSNYEKSLETIKILNSSYLKVMSYCKENVYLQKSMYIKIYVKTFFKNCSFWIYILTFSQEWTKYRVHKNEIRNVKHTYYIIFMYFKIIPGCFSSFVFLVGFMFNLLNMVMFVCLYVIFSILSIYCILLIIPNVFFIISILYEQLLLQIYL